MIRNNAPSDRSFSPIDLGAPAGFGPIEEDPPLPPPLLKGQHNVMDSCDLSSPGLDEIAPAPPPRAPLADDVARVAREKLRDPDVRASFAFDSDYVSTNFAIDGTYTNFNKCNLFAGDTLHEAGFNPPTHVTTDGRIHYKKAEDWPRDLQRFSRVADLPDVRPGDLLVVDRPGTGSSTAHVEVVSDVVRGADGRPARISSIGAHDDGLNEGSRYGDDLINSTDIGSRFVSNPSLPSSQQTFIYVLRPRAP